MLSRLPEAIHNNILVVSIRIKVQLLFVDSVFAISRNVSSHSAGPDAPSSITLTSMYTAITLASPAHLPQCCCKSRTGAEVLCSRRRCTWPDRIGTGRSRRRNSGCRECCRRCGTWTPGRKPRTGGADLKYPSGHTLSI